MTSKPRPVSLSKAALDEILTAQIVVAWAGESGDEPRMGWWRTEMAHEFGGEDLFQRLLPATWPWAVLQAIREAARRHDAAARSKDADPDRLLSLFRLGFEVDEKLDERFGELKRSGAKPVAALPGLAGVIDQPWSRSDFGDWVDGHGEGAFALSPAGRRLKDAPPDGEDRLVKKLVASLAPLADAYPLPHVRRQD